MTTLIPISAVRFLQAFKTRRCAKQAIIIITIITATVIMPYFIQPKLFIIST